MFRNVTYNGDGNMKRELRLEMLNECLTKNNYPFDIEKKQDENQSNQFLRMKN